MFRRLAVTVLCVGLLVLLAPSDLQALQYQDPVLRIVALWSNGWEHVCTAVAMVGGYALTAGHCIDQAVTVRVEYWFYWTTINKIAVSLGPGFDFGIFNYPERVSRFRARLDIDPIRTGEVVLIYGYPRGVRNDLVCVVQDKDPDNGFWARCNGRFAGGGSGAPVFRAYGPPWRVVGVATHLDVRDRHNVFFTDGRTISRFVLLFLDLIRR